MNTTPRDPFTISPIQRHGAILWFVGVYVLYLAQLFFTFGSTPMRVASHFGFEGYANQWMSRGTYFTLIALIPVMFAGIFSLLAWLSFYLPAAMINLPRRDYWLVPQHRLATSQLLWRYLMGLACIMTLFFAGLHMLSLHANTLHPARLPMKPFFMLLIGFFIVVIAWVASMIMRFAQVDQPSRDSASRSHGI